MNEMDLVWFGLVKERRGEGGERGGGQNSKHKIRGEESSVKTQSTR